MIKNKESFALVREVSIEDIIFDQGNFKHSLKNLSGFIKINPGDDRNYFLFAGSQPSGLGQYEIYISKQLQMVPLKILV